MSVKDTIKLLAVQVFMIFVTVKGITVIAALAKRLSQ